MNLTYLLIYYYHDTFIRKFNSLSELQETLAFLMKDYKNDKDFSYEIYWAKNIKF